MLFLSRLHAWMYHERKPYHEKSDVEVSAAVLLSVAHLASSSIVFQVQEIFAVTRELAIAEDCWRKGVRGSTGYWRLLTKRREGVRHPLILHAICEQPLIRNNKKQLGGLLNSLYIDWSSVHAYNVIQWQNRRDKDKLSRWRKTACFDDVPQPPSSAILSKCKTRPPFVNESQQMQDSLSLR